MSWKRHAQAISFRNGELLRTREQRIPLENMMRDVVGDGGMYDGNLIEITFTNGFEAWGAYEGWGQGWIVKLFNTKDQEVIGRGASHYLDSAIENAVKQVKCEHDYSPLIEGGMNAISCKKCGKIDRNREVENKFGPDYE